MNKREWRKCYKDLRDEIDQVRRECAEQLGKAEHSRDYYKSLCEEKQVAGRTVVSERDALRLWQLRVREAWNSRGGMWITELEAAIESDVEPKEGESFVGQITDHTRILGG